MINMAGDAVAFEVPGDEGGVQWRRVADTAAWAEPECNCWPEETGQVLDGEVVVAPWSVVVAHAVKA